MCGHNLNYGPTPCGVQTYRVRSHLTCKSLCKRLMISVVIANRQKSIIRAVGNSRVRHAFEMRAFVCAVCCVCVVHMITIQRSEQHNTLQTIIIMRFSHARKTNTHNKYSIVMNTVTASEAYLNDGLCASAFCAHDRTAGR